MGMSTSLFVSSRHSFDIHNSVVCVSFPPLIGHTTLVTLCGFAYGMEGFYIALAGSIIGSGLVFSVLRLLFSKRIRAWSAQNEKWQALESVVASLLHIFTSTEHLK